MRIEKTRVTVMVCSIALAGVAFAADARAECSRKTLQKLTDTYVKAQTAGDPGKLPLSQPQRLLQERVRAVFLLGKKPNRGANAQ